MSFKWLWEGTLLHISLYSQLNKSLQFQVLIQDSEVHVHQFKRWGEYCRFVFIMIHFSWYCFYKHVENSMRLTFRYVAGKNIKTMLLLTLNSSHLWTHAIEKYEVNIYHYCAQFNHFMDCASCISV